jgi:hypothetical protein
MRLSVGQLAIDVGVVAIVLAVCIASVPVTH